MKLAWLVVGLLAIIQGAHSESRCLGGGDGGGVPFSLIPQGLASNSTLVKTQSLFMDFLLWENTNRLLYIDPSQNYRSHDLASAQEKQVFESGMTTPFSRTIDPGNRYFTTRLRGSLFDTKAGVLTHIPYGTGQKEIFWHDSVLYSVPASEPNGPYGVQTIYAYDTKSSRLSSCSVHSFSKSIPFKVSQQNAFPYLHGYDEIDVGNGEYHIRTMKIDVRNALKGKKCFAETDVVYKDTFPGPIKAMHHYADLNANIFILDRTGKELLWDLGKDECTFYDLQGTEFFVLKSEAPVVALWQEEALSVLYPRRTQKRSLPGVGQFGFNRADFALSKDGKKLFVSQKPEANSESLKLLFQFDLEEMP